MSLPKRKHPRLKNFDYSQNGFYYVTIHVEQNGLRLSHVQYDKNQNQAIHHLTEAGQIAKQQLLALSQRFPFVKVDKYVIMPTHIHVIFEFVDFKGQECSHWTLSDVVGAYKSLTTRICNKQFDTPGKKLFQTSFYESVLRSDEDYRERWKYIEENPLKWSLNPEDL